VAPYGALAKKRQDSGSYGEQAAQSLRQSEDIVRSCCVCRQQFDEGSLRPGAGGFELQLFRTLV
jgi:hypothetical protein